MQITSWKKGDPERRSARRLAADILRIKRIHTKNIKEIEREVEYKAFMMAISMGLMLVLLFLCSVKAHASPVDINMDIITDIESSNEPLAYNKVSGAVGEYQLKQGVVYDFNREMFDNAVNINYSLNDMYSPKKAGQVAQWFINNKIPSELRVYGIPDTVTSRLVAYNWGIGHLRKWFKRGCHWNQLPRETRKYIIKYYKELKGN